MEPREELPPVLSWDNSEVRPSVLEYPSAPGTLCQLLTRSLCVGSFLDCCTSPPKYTTCSKSLSQALLLGELQPNIVLTINCLWTQRVNKGSFIQGCWMSGCEPGGLPRLWFSFPDQNFKPWFSFSALELQFDSHSLPLNSSLDSAFLPLNSLNQGRSHVSTGPGGG
jgi:hypothetical protein